MEQQVDKLMEQLFCVFDKQAPRITQVGVVGIEDVCREQGSEVDNELFVGWHESLSEGTYHLIGVQLLVNLSLCMRQMMVNGCSVLRGYLQDSVVPILRKQRALVVVGITEAEARQHACGIVDVVDSVDVCTSVVDRARRAGLELQS
jgi:hypothetical protein